MFNETCNPAFKSLINASTFLEKIFNIIWLTSGIFSVSSILNSIHKSAMIENSEIPNSTGLFDRKYEDLNDHF